MSIEDKIETEIEVINHLKKQINDVMEGIADKIAPLQKELKETQAGLDKILVEEALKRLDNKPYKCGTANLSAGAFKVKVAIPKSVKWDEKKLLDVERMIIAADKEPRDYIKYKLSVAEKDYDSFSDEIKNVFKAARTVDQGKAKITIELKED